MTETGYPASAGSNSNGVPRLTRRQLSVVHALADGYDIATVAAQRGKGLSSTYELAERICVRLGLRQWQEIRPYAIEHGLTDGDGVNSQAAGSRQN